MANKYLIRQLDKNIELYSEKLRKSLIILSIIDPSQTNLNIKPDPAYEREIRYLITHLSEEGFQNYKQEIEKQITTYRGLKESAIQQKLSIVESKNNRL